MSDSLVDRTGENRSFLVLMTEDDMVVHSRSVVTPKTLTTG
jgi:hypothetical protein